MPLGCMGWFQVTTEALSDMVTTSTTSTIPGAVKCNNLKLYKRKSSTVLPVSFVLPDTLLLGALVPAPLVAVMLTVICWYGFIPVIL